LAIRYSITEELAEFRAFVHICACNQQDIDKRDRRRI